MPTNEFLEFCPTDTGTNLEDIADYEVDAERVSGNKPGIASSALNNRALRQANFVTSQIAQMLSTGLGVDVLDDGVTAKFRSLMAAYFLPLPFVQKLYASGSGNHDMAYVFYCATFTAAAGDTYTNNGNTYTVEFSATGQTLMVARGNAAPSASGTLTRATGSGTSSIAFYAYRKPVIFEVQVSGGGGGGAGSGTGTSGGTGGTGGNTTFGGTIFVGNGGVGAVHANAAGGAGGTASIGTGGAGSSYTGGNGNGSASAVSGSGMGGCGLINQPGSSLPPAGAAQPGIAGGRGCGGSGSPAYVASSVVASGGGGAGGWCSGYIYNPASTYAYVVGAGGTAGTAGTSGAVGGAGGAGVVIVRELYQ